MRVSGSRRWWLKPFSGTLRGPSWYLVTDVSVQPISPTFKSRAAPKLFLTAEGGTEMFPRISGIQHPTYATQHLRRAKISTWKMFADLLITRKK